MLALLADSVTDGAGWLGFLMTAAAMIRGEYAAYTARKLASEKAESDRLSARDKLEFDAKFVELKTAHEARAADLEECKRDRAALWIRVAALESAHVAPVVPAPKVTT